ncbi:MAG: FlgO family outer membrane protein [Treponema sp.]
MKKTIFAFVFGFVAISNTLFCISCSKKHSDSELRIAITTFDARGIEPNDIEFVMNSFTTAFANLGVAKIVDRGSFDKARGNLHFNASDWSDSKKVSDLGKALNATHVVVGQLMKRDFEFFLTVKILDVSTSTIISSHLDRVASIDDFFEKMPEFCRQLIAKTNASTLFTNSGATNVTDLAGDVFEGEVVSGKVVPKTTTSSKNVTEYDVGDDGPGGGIVFYVSKRGFMVHDGLGGKRLCYYLEMSRDTLGESLWFPEYNEIGTKKELGYGKANTYRILNQLTSKALTEENCAAYRCSRYFTINTRAGEWFLPSEDELDLMRRNQQERVLAYPRRPPWYWSSTEVSSYSAYFRTFYNVDDLREEDMYKVSNEHLVRAVRAF